MCVRVRVRIIDESVRIGFLMTAVYFFLLHGGVFSFCTLFKLFVVHTINILSHTLSRNIKIYSSRNFLIDICTRLKARANIDKKITQRINLILHSRVCDNIYLYCN